MLRSHNSYINWRDWDEWFRRNTGLEHSRSFGHLVLWLDADYVDWCLEVVDGGYYSEHEQIRRQVNLRVESGRIRTIEQVPMIAGNNDTGEGRPSKHRKVYPLHHVKHKRSPI